MNIRAAPGDGAALLPAVMSAMAGSTLTRSKPAAADVGCVFDTLDSCISLRSPFAAAKLVAVSSAVGLPSKAFEQCLVEQWAQFAERQLATAVTLALAGRAEGVVEGALAKLVAALPKLDSTLAGPKLSLADVAVWCQLYPLCGPGAKVSMSLPPPLVSWFNHLAGQEAFVKGVATTLDGAAPESIAERAAAAAFLSTGPPRVMPKAGKRNILVTSALPYVNNVPHLGNIIGCVLSADVYARYCRSRGYNVIYVCGTDEYGTATETKALEEGLAPREICDKYHKIHKGIYEWFDIKFDQFGRTSTPKQTTIAQGIFNSLMDKKLLYEDGMEQLYDEIAKKFLADRFVEGTCPKCGYEDARGDQCDACGTLLNPMELKNPRSKLSGGTPRPAVTQHMFLNLPEISGRLQDYISEGQVRGGWSSNTVTITNSWLRDGLKSRCITRDLQWGVPVPIDHLKEKVLYVWFDAPIGYISITAAYTDDWEEWWKNKDVELVQFMGKDNVPFHTVIFPSMLIGTGEPWTLMRSISTTEYLNYEDQQFSKSRGVGVFGNHCRETNIPPEVWRYYLLVNRPESADTKFLWTDLAAKNNSELLNNLGNFSHRTLSFAASRLDGVVPQLSSEHDSIGVELGAKIQPIVVEYVEMLEKLKIKDGLRVAMKVSSAGNLFFQEQQPWVVLKTDKAKCATILACCMGLVKLLAVLLEPYMPSVSEKLLAQLGQPGDSCLTDEFVARVAAPHRLLPAGHKLGASAPIFRTIPDEEIEEMRARFSGNQASDATKAAANTKSAPAAGDKGKAKTGKDGKLLDKNGKPLDAADKKAEKAAKAAAGVKCNKAPAVDRDVDFSRLDVRVGKITECKKHPDADALYVEQIDLGEGQTRTVVSGLVKFIPLEKMIGADVVVVANMKPAAMRGIKSEGMVLAASNADGTHTELVTPPAGSKIGERVVCEGFEQEPDEQLNPKKKVFEGVQPDLKSTSDCVAAYKGIPFKTSAGVCKVNSIAGGSIK
mmetsp:Transcript_35423/g.67796  ORF Transcript_35423/g.67796 Transcript_35423/m.67796 type:complete len:1001 (-) Transcript_35423:335-3337(-)